MKIQYLGHSCFKLTGNAGTTIVTDPYANVGYELPKSLRADVVTVSHGHFDHDNVRAVGGVSRIIDKEGFYELPGVKIEGIGSLHDNCGGKKRGKNIIYKFCMDGLTICHLGDLGEDYSAELVKRILPVDVLLIPIGGVYTIDAIQAKKYVEGIRPGIVVPMHYKTEDLSIDVDKADRFLNLFGIGKSELLNRDVLELSRDDLTKESTKIILMERTNL